MILGKIKALGLGEKTPLTPHVHESKKLQCYKTNRYRFCLKEQDSSPSNPPSYSIHFSPVQK